MKYFEDYAIGQEQLFANVYRVERDEIIEFAQKWDPQPFHTDEAAAKDSVFGGLVAASAHTFAIFSWFGTQVREPVAVLAALGFDELKMRLPIRPGDEIRAVAHCIAMRESRSRPDCGVIETATQLLNQSEELVLSVRTAMLVAKRPAVG